MVRKRRTELSGGGESSEYPETGGGRGGAQCQPPQQQQQLPQQGVGGRGWGPQRGGYGGRGRMPPQPYYGWPPEYQRGRGGKQYQRGPPPQGRGGIVVGRGPGAPAGGPSRTPTPELHQAMQVPYPATLTTLPVPYGSPAGTYVEAGSSSQSPEPSEVTEQIEQLGIQSERRGSKPSNATCI